MSKSSGLIGIDIAYLFALLGTIFSSVFFVVGGRMHMLSHEHYFLILDFFPSLFFFLNGMTVTLTMRDRRISSRRLQAYLGKRGSILLLLGLLFVKSWHMNLLLACGIFYLIAPIVAEWNNIILRTLGVGSALLAMVMINFDVPASVTTFAVKLSGANGSDLLAFMLFNGYFSVLPWITFFLAGMLYGRSEMRPRGLFPPSSIICVVLIGLSFFVEDYCKTLYGLRDSVDTISVFPFNLKFYLPAYLIYALACCVLLLNIILYVFRKDIPKNFEKFIQSFSSSKYSIYFFTSLIGFILLNASNAVAYRDKFVILITALIVMILAVFLTMQWKKRLTPNAPVEWLIKRISGSAKK